MSIRALLTLALLAGLLAACATTPPPEPDPPAIRGTVYDLGDGAPDPIAVGMVLLTPEFLTTGLSAASLTRAQLVEPVPGVWMGAFVTVDGGAFDVFLPDEEGIPAAALVPLAEAVDNFTTCTVDAAPISARATFTIFEGLSVPGLAALTVEGSGLMVASDVEVDPLLGLAEQDVAFQGWIFVDRAATLETSDCEYVADLTLAEGWNQLAWSIGDASIEVTVVAEADVVAALEIAFPPAP